MEAIEKVKNEHFDLMILDFIMTPIHGEKVVEEIRKFNKELYILLLTGHKDFSSTSLKKPFVNSDIQRLL